MNCDRRQFIRGAAAFGSLGGGLFPCLAADAGDSPRLRFGVLSDVHVNEIGPDGKTWGNALLKKALRWYSEQCVDAIVIAGDLADQGLGCNLEAVADAWYSVFPGDRAKDGRKVEKVFVTGNHDFGAAWYTDYAKRTYPDPEERKRQILRFDFEGWWKKVFHEDYHPFFAKTVKGFTFCGQQWDDGSRRNVKGATVPFGEALEAFLRERGSKLDPMQPFFYVQHPHPYGTCFGPWAWGHDRGRTTEILSRYPNAIAFSGHSHYPMADERAIWQGSFTSVGVGSLRYGTAPSEEFAPGGYENGSAGRQNWRIDSQKVQPVYRTDVRSGMLWSVFGDRIVASRRDFAQGVSLGPDWELPLTVAADRPYAFAEHARRIGVPEFSAGARLKVEIVRAKTRGAKKQKVDSVEVDSLRVDIPAAVAKDGARVWRYRVEIQDLSDPQTQNVLASGYDLPTGDVTAMKPTTCYFDLNAVPRGNVLISVVPYNCFGRFGKALLQEVKI